MSEKEFKSYRFNAKTEPTDEMLDHLMAKAAREVRQSNNAADSAFFESLRKVSAQKRAEAKSINS